MQYLHLSVFLPCEGLEPVEAVSLVAFPILECKPRDIETAMLDNQRSTHHRGLLHLGVSAKHEGTHLVEMGFEGRGQIASHGL